ncbi:metal-dependent hydrolase [Neorhodopirellula lusitana]|uniref:metal-dependent hydrolase n=1 Tax=Neorhodopirellula lusitana TaxID=445327 RepID=UPI00384D86E9
MAGFKTHISTSTMVGVAYGYWGVVDQGMSLESALLAGGLCSVAGMLPDLDSDTGVPLRETSLFLAATAPMLMMDRWKDMGLTHESMALAAMVIYVAIRFVAVEFFKRYTVHRGMWHSIPAALVSGLVAYLLMPCPSEAVRVYKSLAVFVGFMTHLMLDEIWSLDFSGGRFRVKKSFGTALKFFGNNWAANVSVYAKLALLIYVAQGDHEILDRLRQRTRLDQEQYTLPGSTSYPSFSLPWRSKTETASQDALDENLGGVPGQSFSPAENYTPAQTPYGAPANPWQQAPVNATPQPYQPQQQQPYPQQQQQYPPPQHPQQQTYPAPQPYPIQHRVADPRTDSPALPY